MKLKTPRRTSAAAAVFMVYATAASAYTTQELNDAIALGCTGGQPTAAANTLVSFLVNGTNSANDAVVTAVSGSCSALILAYNAIAPSSCLTTVSFAGTCKKNQ
jgi:hypothetical protein